MGTGVPSSFWWIAIGVAVVGIFFGRAVRRVRTRAMLGLTLGAEHLMQSGLAKDEVRDRMIEVYERAGLLLLTEGGDRLVFQWRFMLEPWQWVLIVVTAPVSLPILAVAWVFGLRPSRVTLHLDQLAGPREGSRVLPFAVFDDDEDWDEELASPPDRR